MLTYSLAVGKAGRSVPPSTLDVLRDADVRELPFHPRDHRFWCNQSGSVAFAGWQDALDDRGIGSHVHQHEGWLTAFTGLLWPRGGPWPIDRPWTEHLAEYLRAHSLEEGTEDLLGVFTAVSLDQEGRGVAASDPLGIGILYIAETAEMTVLSTRANLAARIAAPGSDPPPRDTLGSCWLAYSPYPIGSRTGFEGVEVVPAGSAVRIDPANGVGLRRTTPPPWRLDQADADLQALVDDLHGDIVSTIRAAWTLPVREHLADLTGGKDSRLVLAVTLGEGLADEFEFRTWGSPDLPDVVIARRIADRFGLRHGVNIVDRSASRSRTALDAALNDAGNPTLADRETEMRVTVGSWFGMRNVFEPRAACPGRSDTVRLSGLCGEVLRTNFPGAGHLRSMRAVEEFPRRDLKFGGAGILRPEAEQHYDEEVRRALLSDYGEHGAPQDAVDAFYVRNRLRRWFGTGQEVDADNRVFPLYSHAGVRAAFAIGAQDRHAEWLHFRIIRRACEPLSRLPFDGERHERPRTVLRDIRRRHETTDVEIMRPYLLDDRSNPVFEVVDRDAVESSLARFTDLTERAKRQLYGALTAAIWLGGSELTVRPQVR